MAHDTDMQPFDELETPVYIVDTHRLQANLEVLRAVKERSGCHVLLALKAFAMWCLAPRIRTCLDGVCASSPWEARLGREYFGGEVHGYAPAYSSRDMHALAACCDVISFNWPGQWERLRPLLSGAERAMRFGLRVNPCLSTQSTPQYDPCAPRSRLGALPSHLADGLPDGISGLHFHTLCEQGADALALTLQAFEKLFAKEIAQAAWVNFGGGHWITRPGYDIDLLCRLIVDFRQRHGTRIYIEPGEAVVLGSGVLVGTVLDIFDHGGPIAILDLSCAAHMPDVLEMPYRPEVHRIEDGLFAPPQARAAQPDHGPYSFRLAGLSCLAGDVIGDYTFERPLRVGDRLVFEDMAHYTMVKSTFFNGVRHPDLAIYDSSSGNLEIVRRFDYGDFKARLS